MRDDIVQEGLDELPCVDVVWDEGVLSDQNMHGGLLEQLVMGVDYKDDEKKKLLIELNANEVLTGVGSLSLFLI